MKGIGNVEGRADRCLQSHCTYWSADGRMKLIFWGRQCRHISFSRCKATLSRGSGGNLVHLDRLWSLASANCTGLDGTTHPSCSPACLTTMVLTLSLMWYTHAVMDSRQHALWQDREINLHSSRACCLRAAGEIPFIHGKCIQYPGHCTAPMWTISLTCPMKVAFLTRRLQSSSPLTNNYNNSRARPKEQVRHTQLSWRALWGRRYNMLGSKLHLMKYLSFSVSA